MGLDMYLKKNTYVKNWDHNPKEQHFEITVKQNGKDYSFIDKTKITDIVEEVMYWRKFNALHRWIVNNCAGGTDECQPITVDKESFLTLYDTLKQINADNSKAEELLPTTSGFFFGSTECDEYYFDQVRDTLDALQPIVREVSNPEESQSYRVDFVYRASW